MVRPQHELLAAIQRVLIPETAYTPFHGRVQIKVLENIPTTSVGEHGTGDTGGRMILVGRHGATCPYCNAILKNRTTLGIHIQKCHSNNQTNDQRQV